MAADCARKSSAMFGNCRGTTDIEGNKIIDIGIMRDMNWVKKSSAIKKYGQRIHSDR